MKTDDVTLLSVTTVFAVGGVAWAGCKIPQKRLITP
jgi:hypothetical protein